MTEPDEYGDVWTRRAPEDLRPKCLMVMGLPGSGKSTYVTHLMAKTPGAILIHPDSIRREVTGSEADMTRDPFIWQTLIPCRIVGAVGRPIVFDATMTTKRGRKGILRLARENGYRIEAHVMRTPVEVCKARNAARERVVPVEVIDRMAAKWQDPAVPEMDAVIEVKPDWGVS